VSEAITVITEDEVVVDGRREGDRLLVPAASLAAATGWELKPEGLCQAGVCVPVRDPAGLVEGDDVDIAELARRVGRVVAVDADAGVAVIGASAAERGSALATLHAPAFTLPDLQGHPVSLDDFSGRKRLLLAFASW
jgi:hypothetical protein